MLHATANNCTARSRSALLLALATLLLCAPAYSDTLSLIQITWDSDFGANRWDYSWTPSTNIGGGDYMEITGMEDILGAAVEAAGAPYANPGPTQRWIATYTDTSVRWTRVNATLGAGDEYAYFSYWSDWGEPGSLKPYFRDGVYQGHVTGAPEPGTMLLCAAGVAGIAIRLRRRKSG